MTEGSRYIYIYIPIHMAHKRSLSREMTQPISNNGTPQCPYNLTSTRKSSLLHKRALTHSYRDLRKNTNFSDTSCSSLYWWRLEDTAFISFRAVKTLQKGWNEKIVALEKTTWFHFRLMKTCFLFFFFCRPSTSWPVVYKSQEQ